MPEVRALAADLQSRMRGRTVERVQLAAFSALKTFDPPLSALEGAPCGPVRTFGKYLDVALGDLHLVVHLAKAGWIRWHDTMPALGRTGRGPVAARVLLQDGSGLVLTEAGTKKSLALWLVRAPQEVPGLATLGPDPLAADFGADDLAAILQSAGRAQIKGVLRNQSLIGGIGNAYSDEILHVARMSPFKPAAMTREESDRLYVAVRETLEDAIRRSDGLAAAQLKGEKKTGMRVHGRTGEACPVCGDTVRMVRFADNSLQYCATCQTGGKPLADRAMSKFGVTR